MLLASCTGLAERKEMRECSAQMRDYERECAGREGEQEAEGARFFYIYVAFLRGLCWADGPRE